MEPIYYVFLKSTGEFMGSGITFFDDEVHGCTETANPPYSESQMAFWTGSEWEIRDR